MNLPCLVTRGNVAIYCYNALTAKTWDVTESTNGELTSSKTNDTILAKYFSDFVNEAGKMKLVEDAKITATGATTTAIGANQVKIVATDLVDFIDAEKAPKRGEEEVTYYVTGSTDTVVAYVPTEVANIANMLNKTVDVIFGKDNEVAYLVVTSDVVDNSFVTAWDYDTSVEADSTIEIDGEEYEFASKVKVSVYNYVLNTAVDAESKLTYADGIALIEGLLNTTLGWVDGKGNLTRNVVADYELDADDEIEAINFKFSADYNNGVKVEEKIVEKVTSKKFEYASGSDSISTLEDKEPRVVRNNEIASLDDIEAGDVLTIITTGSNVVIYATANTVEGTLVDYTAKTNALEVDGNEYKVVAAPVYNVDGETDDYTATTAADLLTSFEDEDVVAYMNMFGEVVAVVGESEATGMTLGVVTFAETATDEDSDDVEYLKVKILAEDGSNKSYKIYNKKTNKNVSDADEWSVIDALAKDDIVVFSADADRIIKSDDIEVVVDGNDYNVSNNEVVATTVTIANVSADIENERITDNNGTDSDESDDVTYKYTNSTVIINYNENEKELISWEALTNSDSANYANYLGATEMTIFTKGTKLIYVVADVAKAAYGASDDMYGIITDFSRDYDEDGDRIYLVTVLVEGEEETYECTSALRETFEIGDLIAFNVSEDAIKETTTPTAAPVIVAAYDLVEALEDVDDEDVLTSAVLAMVTANAKTGLVADTTKLEYIKVDAVDAETIEFKYAVPVAEVVCDCGSETATVADETSCTDGAHVPYAAATEKDAYRIVDLDEDVVVYNLVAGEMGEVAEGDYALVLSTDADAEIEIVIIVK